MVETTPRSVRNNNPGNIVRTNIAWEGLAAPDEMTPAQQTETRFCVFASPKWGFRALALDLHNKWHRGLHTVHQIMAVYAPSNENDTGAYVAAVCRMMGVGPDDRLQLDDPSQLASFCRAIAVHEAGGWMYSDDDLVEGVRMALEPPTTLV
ncbi:MAG TPA: structural protein [Micropepsaceae bacterium]|nr:structural protein [Micropepsaceae bacterium]